MTSLLTHNECAVRYGDPAKERGMIVWRVPPELSVGKIPAKIYCNEQLVAPLSEAFGTIINRGLINQLHSWDGCFCIRTKKSGSGTPSLHSWGLAIDINQADNQYGKPPAMSPELVACFTDAGFDWGGYWKIPDGMHFQLKKELFK